MSSDDQQSDVEQSIPHVSNGEQSIPHVADVDIKDTQQNRRATKKEELFFQMEKEQKRVQLIPDSFLLGISAEYKALRKLNLGIDQVLLRLDEEDFQKQNAFTPNDLQKLRADCKNYHKHLMKNSDLFLPKDLFQRVKTRARLQKEEEFIKKKNKPEVQEERDDQERASEASKASESYQDSSYSYEHESSEEEYSVERDDYD